MFNIETFNFSNKDFDNWNNLFDYHSVYILENGKDAYVGESNDFIRRAKEHDSDSLKNKLKKYFFKRMHVITGKLAEETPSKHYENLLIKLMKVDKNFNVVNGNAGQNTHYYRKNIFELYFDDLWFKLEQKGLVRSHDFNSILNSNLFKYSPFTTLTQEQQKTLTSIIHTLDSCETEPHKENYKNRPIFINGDAGTGKTVVAISLFYFLRNNERYKDKKIGLVYANPSIRAEIQEVFKNIKGLSKNDVISPICLSKEHYDIIICDEAQRLRHNKNLGLFTKFFKEGNSRLGLDSNNDELDWILTNSDCQILFYDSKQITSPCDIPQKSFESRLQYDSKRGIRPIKLNEQMRIMAGNNYVPYIYDILFQKTVESKIFDNYEFKLFDSFKDMAKLIAEKEQTIGLCRYCSGYDWEWKAKNNNRLADITLDGIDIQWNKQTAGWLRNPDASKEMGSIYTLPGVDLNYAAVVIGPSLYFDKSENKIKLDRNKFFDNKLKKGVNDDDLLKYVLNTYAVFLTRGIKGTFVYVCDENLRDYFKKFIPLA